MSEEIILRAENIVKSFYGNRVLNGVEISLKPGKVHALCGENGAGKSTLLKIITGLYTKDSGQIYMDGKEIEVKNVETARKYGIHVVPQEMQMLRELSVAENIFLGNQPRTKAGTIDWKTMYRRANEVKSMLGKPGEKINVRTKAGDLGMGAWQLIEIMRAFTSDNLRVIAFDEPTSSLSDSEVEILFSLIRDLRARGIAIVYVSHRMKEIFELCDEVSIFRDGNYVGTRAVKDTTNDELVSMMIGRDVNLFGDHDHSDVQEQVALRATNFSHGKFYQDINLEVHKGEILGLYGLVGAGRTELMRSIYGADPTLSGTVLLGGKKIENHSPAQAIANGIALCPEDRKEQGIIPTLSVGMNISISVLKRLRNACLLIDAKRETQLIEGGIRQFKIRTPNAQK